MNLLAFFLENDLTVSVDGHQQLPREQDDQSQHNEEDSSANNIPMTIHSPIASISSNSSSNTSDEQSLTNSSTKVLITPLRKFGHRRAYSTDTAIL